MSATECPICQRILLGLSDIEVQNHVEDCLRNGEPIQHEKRKKDFTCSVCKEFFDFEEVSFLDCGHFFCTKCLKTSIMKSISHKKITDIICLSCKKTIIPQDLKIILSKDEYDLYERNSVDEVVTAGGAKFARCPKEDCTNIIEIANSGKALKTAQEHKDIYRFRCRECSTEFCASCLIIPYHEGYTCKQFKEFKDAKHCRFCGDKLTSKNQSKKNKKFPALADICKKNECMERGAKVCRKQLLCEHYCGGVLKEKHCLPCLHCKSDLGQTGDDYCNICWTEDLKSAPAIQLKCGHIFHYQCIENQLTKKWHTTNISFGFCECPLCSRWITHPSVKEIMDPIQELYNDIKDKAMQRLKYQKLDNAKEIVGEGEIFYNNPVGYALKRFCYYPCYKCKKPYFGGERACNAELLVNPNFDPAELLCGSCSAGDNKQNCNKHGADFIEWKCKFCCQIACWFCWGNTHFCEDCHKQAVNVSKLPRDQLPKCSCNVEHPPNGEEHCFGCSLCLAKTTKF